MALQTKTLTFGQYSTEPYGVLTVVEESTSVSGNTSSLTITLTLKRPYSISSSATKTASCTIDGTKYTWSGEIGGSGDKTLISKTQTVTHGTDGTKSISIAAQIDFGGIKWNYTGNTIYTKSGSDTMTLTAIPRYGTSVQSLASKTETSITINWSSDSTVDYIWWSKNNGSNWTGINVTDGTSGSYTISGLTANTAYNVKTRIRRKDSQLTTDSSTLSVTTYNYPYATSMPNFTIGNELTVGFYNPLGRQMSVYLIANGVSIANNPWTISGTSYTGFNANSTIEQLYASIPNARSATYKIRVVYGSSTIERTGGTYSVNTSVASPTVSGLTYVDTNSTSVGITGDNQKIVQNISTVRYTASGVTVKNSATLSSVKVSVNGATYTLSASGSNYVGGNAIINSGNNVTATVTVTDSRGLTGTKSVTVQMVAYSNPNAIITLKRKNNFYAETTLNVDANYVYIGSNAVTITYQAKQTGTDTWTESGTLQDNVPVTLTLDNQYAWDFQIVLVDSLGGRTPYNASLKRGIPHVFFDRLRNSVGFGAIPDYDNAIQTWYGFRSKGHDSSYPFYAVKYGTERLKHVYLGCRRDDTGSQIDFGVGNDGVKRGIYDRTNTVWMLYMDADTDKAHFGVNVDAPNIGTVVNGTTITTSVSSGVDTDIISMTLPAGTWIVTGYLQWGAGFTQPSQVQIAGSGTYTNLVRGTGVNGGGQEAVVILPLTEQKTLTLRAYQSSGSDKTTSNAYMRAVRIK